MTIRKQLVALSIGVAVPLLLSGLIALYGLWSETRYEIAKSLEQQAHLAALALDQVESIDDIFRELELPEGAVITVYDDTGTILYRSLTPQSLVGDDFSDSPLLQELGDRRSVLVEAPSPSDGVMRVHALARSRTRPFIIKIGIPSESLYEPARTQLGRYVLSSCVAVALAVAAAAALASRIEGPVRRLSSAALRLGAGAAGVRARREGGAEIAELGAAFNSMAERIDEREARLTELNTRLAELNDIKSDVVSGVSHELRTPLTTIKTMASLLKHDELSAEERRECLEVITAECDRQIDLVLNLLDLSRIEAGAFDYGRTPVDVAELLRVCLRVERYAAQAKGSDLSSEVEAGLPPALTDRKAMRRVLCVLIENAIKYTPAGGRIRVAARRDGEDRVAITVADTGPGIAEEDFPRLFDKFFRGRARATGELVSDSGTPGVGLGLYLARAMVDHLGGTIGAVNAPEGGSRFTVSLPTPAADAAESETTDHAEETSRR